MMASPAAHAAAVERAVAELGARAHRDAPLGALTTYRVGGTAAVFVVADDVDDLRAVARAAGVSGLPVLVVGRGSNLLVSDGGFPGIAVQLGAVGAGIEQDGTDVVAGGGVLLPVLARRTAALGLTGFEWAVGVPGSVGGAVRMNAGGHGSDMATVLAEARVFDLRSGRDETWTVPELGLRFRGSALTDDHVVLAARLRLATGDRRSTERQIAEIVRWRRAHQPGGQNAGSVFVNPVPGQLAAAELIDALGLRGARVGTAEVSPKHANFVQADEGGRAADVVAVIEMVRAKVAEAFGIVLRTEVRLVGFGTRAEPEVAR
jgi:UDP-N-acetylmuramate dehydrogenase